MIRHAIALAVLALSVLANPARAQDPRLVERLYDPSQVVRIDGRTNVQSTIRFGAGEAIENVAIGDSEAWQVTPNRRGNLLFVKPLMPRGMTNMTVITNRFTYLFDLVANPDTRVPVYVLSFVYPAELLPPPREEPETPDGPEGPNALELAAAKDEYAVLDPNRINFDWNAEGSLNLAPTEIYDNGEATFLTWEAARAVPAILVMNQDGDEGPANYAVRGDTIVLDFVPDEIILRSGEDEARLFNQGASGDYLADGTARSLENE